MEMGDKTARVLETRQRILEILKGRGPSLPVHVAKGTGISMIFAGAFLSELISEKYVKTSHMRVGGSPLYLLPGQEPLLENFSHFLGSKEKEAFLLLKERRILQDDKLEPALRVAMRGIRDFAEQIMVKQKLDNLDKEFIFWRYFLHSEDEAKKSIEEILEPKKEKKETGRGGKVTEVEKVKEVKKEERVEEKKAVKRKRFDEKAGEDHALLPVQKEILGDLAPIPDAPEKTAFALSLEESLDKTGIKILETKLFSKKDYEAVVEVDTPLGRMKFLAVARDKKLVADADLIAALQKAQTLRLPALFLAPGKLNKKAQDYLERWHAFLKFKRIE